FEEDLLRTLVATFDVATLARGNRGEQPPKGAGYALAVRRHIHRTPLDEVDIGGVAEGLGIGRHHLTRCFRAHYGVSIQEFIHFRRLHAARGLLMSAADEITVTDAAYSSGFNHLGRFSTQYRELFGETPRQTRRLAARA
ncbi:MAG: helix-turn-helix domain-containing protein, partial [Thermoanaerobaculia bacterium]|nr:helix-turn-helix domain-containing protein [Thermoanaerobaculia bacterium]